MFVTVTLFCYHVKINWASCVKYCLWSGISSSSLPLSLSEQVSKVTYSMVVTARHTKLNARWQWQHDEILFTLSKSAQDASLLRRRGVPSFLRSGAGVALGYSCRWPSLPRLSRCVHPPRATVAGWPPCAKRRKRSSGGSSNQSRDDSVPRFHQRPRHLVSKKIEISLPKHFRFYLTDIVQLRTN